MRDTTRVLVVEDSPSMREFLVRVITADPRFDVVGTARDGEEAVRLVASLRPDVVTMDLHLPRLDGVAATRQIMAEHPVPIVVVTTTSKDTPDGLAFQALQAGAVTLLDKPPAPAHPNHLVAVRELLGTLRLMSEVKVVRRTMAREVPRPLSGTFDRFAITNDRPQAIVMAASTGGPQAIQTVLQALGDALDVPMLIVQHMSSGFLEGMANWLDATCPQSVRLARHGDEPRGNIVYIAPEDDHLLVTRRRTLALSKAPPVGGFRPSANVLFESAAGCYGARAIGAVLTGMGDDGAAGLAALRATGASTIVQDETSSVVYGMPRAASVAAEYEVPLVGIAPLVQRLLGLTTAARRADT